MGFSYTLERRVAAAAEPAVPGWGIAALKSAGSSRGRSFGMNEQAAAKPDRAARVLPVTITDGSGEHVFSGEYAKPLFDQRGEQELVD